MRRRWLLEARNMNMASGMTTLAMSAVPVDVDVRRIVVGRVLPDDVAAGLPLRHGVILSRMITDIKRDNEGEPGDA